MAQLTINIPDGEVSRVEAAFTSSSDFANSGLTANQYMKQQVVGFIKNRVLEYERSSAVQTAFASVTEVTPS